jgi:hypothetical protein
MLQKTKTTSKKFYNKWVYKVSLRIPGCAIFRISSLDDIRLFCNQPESEEPTYTVYHRAWTNKDQILELAEFLIQYHSNLWTKRIEGSVIDLYTNDLEFYSKVSKKFESEMTHRFEPLAGTTDSLDQPQTIVASKLPHNKYHYKVYLLPHKLAGEKETKIKFVDWLKSQDPKITCTPAVQKWFIKTDWNWDRRYVLVEDEHTLLMLKLRNSEVVGRVYKYVITDK